MNAKNEEIELLFARVASGDDAAFRSLYDVTANWVYSIALRLLRDKEAAEDAVQETFVKIWRTAERFDPASGSPGSWIGIIARNTSLDLIRKRRPVIELSDNEVAMIVTEPIDPPDIKLGRCLACLPADQARAIVIMYTYGMSHAELAEHMGVPLGTVKSWVRRGSQSLKLCMESRKI
jgi:RNA polymerase sigma-70 factor, ECF subfamily